jgi:hypothetical protein
MSAVALLALFFATGVDSGWQPMPDGSPRSEYIVQVEPEMLAALADGQSVPIVSEVPAEAQPIGRIRIVVGRDALPRQRATTRLKPTDYPAARGATSIELTQYTEPVGQRYATPPATATTGYDPYTQLPPTAPSATGGAWNQDAASDNPLREPAPPASGAGGWNGGVTEVADASAARGPLQRVGDGIQEVTDPIRDGIDRIDDRVRTAAENLGARTQGVIDQLRPEGGIFGGAATPAPGAAGSGASGWNGGAAAVPTGGALATTPVDSAATSAPGWNGGAGPAVSAPVASAAATPEPPRSAWNQDASVAVDSGAGFAGASPDGPVAPPLATGGAATPRGSDGDPWAQAADPRLRGDGLSSATGAAGSTAATGPAAPSAFPGVGAAPPFGGSAGPLLGSASGATGTPAAGSPPAVTGGMLAQPATRPLDGVDPMTSPFTPGGSTLGATPAFTPAGGLGGAPSPLQTAAAQGWGTGAQGAAGTDQQTAGEKANSGSDARHRAAVIMAWVLLSGSAAGNIYLFWSYLDVRTKYRSLVRKTARAVGSRFSAA